MQDLTKKSSLSTSSGRLYEMNDGATRTGYYVCLVTLPYLSTGEGDHPIWPPSVRGVSFTLVVVCALQSQNQHFGPGRLECNASIAKGRAGRSEH